MSARACMRRGWVPALAAMAVIAACGSQGSAVPYYEDADLTPVWLSEEDALSPSLHRIATFELTDQEGRPVTESDLKGRIVVADFFFTDCGDICPAIQVQLARLRARFATNDVLLVSHSVAPERDSPERMAAWGEARGIDPEGWRLLTGPAATIERLAADSYFVELSDGSGHGVQTIAHTETVVLLDPELRIRGVYNGTLGFDIDQLAQDIEVLLSDATPPRTGP